VIGEQRIGYYSLASTEVLSGVAGLNRRVRQPFGTVSEVKLITDRETGQSRGFGFVTMSNVSEGNAAIKGLNGKDKGGRKLTVNEARPKDDRGGRPSPGSRR
jgi:cold-inducible RNA-binding protein